MPNAFTAGEVRRIIRRAEVLQSQAESNPTQVRISDWRSFHDEVLAYVEQNMRFMLDNFVERELRRRRGVEGDVPGLFVAIRDRYITQWRETLTRAFSTAIDSLQQGERNQSILQRVMRFIKNALGIRGTAGVRQGGTFTHQGKRYWNYTLLYLASTKTTRTVDISDIRVSNRNPEITTPQLVVIAHSGGYLLYSGHRLLEEAREQGLRRIFVRVLDAEDLKQAEVVVPGFARAGRGGTRGWSMKFVAYLRLLFKTIPRNLDRDLLRAIVRFDALREGQEARFLVTGGVIATSATTCRFVNNKVLTQEALDFVTASPELRDHLFHPNCRHRLVAPPDNFRGQVWDVVALRNRVRSGALR